MNLETGRMLTAILVALSCCIYTDPATAQETPQRKLQILVIAGEGSINNIKQRTAREPVVEVQDENNRPVAGAIVFFKLPDYGASGTFTNGSKFITVTTDQQGQAVGRNFQPNQAQGDLQIQVTAS